MGLQTNKHNLYNIQKGSLKRANTVFYIDPTPYLAYDNVSSFVGPWTIFFGAAQAQPTVNLGACSGLGFIQGEYPGFSWIDPDNVLLNGSLLAQWNRTVLVRKENSYPTSYQDGTILTYTSKSLGNKNYYRDHTFSDQTAQTGKTYYYKLFSETIKGSWNALTANEYTDGTGLSWYQVQQYVKDGRGPELFPVGTVFQVQHSDFQHTDGHGLYFRVIGHDQISASDESIQHTMLLECTECIAQLPFDAIEFLYAITDDEKYKSGVNYYSLSGTTYTLLSAGVNYNIGDTIPLATIYQKNFNTTANSVGNYDYGTSNIDQWLNSDKAGGLWFNQQTIFDLCDSNLLNRDGFLKNINSQFKQVIQQAKLIRSYNGVEQQSINRKIFLISYSQITNSAKYGWNSYSVMEGVGIKYYYVSGGSTIKNVINQSSNCKWFQASRGRGNDYWTNSIAIIKQDGTVINGGDGVKPKDSYGVCPYCIIG